MAIYLVENAKLIENLFAGWEDTMIWSFLDGSMGSAYANHLTNPTAAQICVGGFCFFAGEVDVELIGNCANSEYEILVPPNMDWEKGIQNFYGSKAQKHIRYAIKKEASVFNCTKLEDYVAALPKQYQLKKIDEELYSQIAMLPWASDLCANFNEFAAFEANALGFVILQNGEIVSGASSYTFYKKGIEIEIDTRRDARRNGLALVCASKLILEALKRNLYPSWDAHNKASLALAEKLGYHFDKEYVTYMLAKE